MNGMLALLALVFVEVKARQDNEKAKHEANLVGLTRQCKTNPHMLFSRKCSAPELTLSSEDRKARDISPEKTFVSSLGNELNLRPTKILTIWTNDATSEILGAPTTPNTYTKLIDAILSNKILSSKSGNGKVEHPFIKGEFVKYIEKIEKGEGADCDEAIKDTNDKYVTECKTKRIKGYKTVTVKEDGETQPEKKDKSKRVVRTRTTEEEVSSSFDSSDSDAKKIPKKVAKK